MLWARVQSLRKPPIFTFCCRSKLAPIGTQNTKGIEGSYIIDFRKRLNNIGETKLWIEGIWARKLKRVNDASTMKSIKKLKGTTAGESNQVNTVRIWTRVVIITDMTNKAATRIMNYRMRGE